MKRRLAAILAADVVGYSRLMGEDEAGTLGALTAHREELLAPKIAEHRGRIFKLMGDGLLAEFASVVDAVQCAVEMQESMAARNAGIEEDRRIVFPIGINMGDIIVEDEDIYGDGVNLAARLEGLADPGGICLSRNVHEQVGTKLDLTFEDLGELEVKNIAEPVRAYRIKMASAQGEGATGGRAAPPLPDRPSVAVLAFENMSGDPEEDYFADGITEDIITDLSRFHGLLVIARNSSFSYKGKAIRVQEIARQLGVRYLVEGSIRRAGARLRITVQLIDATSGGHLWAERYDRELEDVFALQDEIVETVVRTVAGRLTAADRARAARKTPRNLQAYDYVLRAQGIVNDSIEKNRQCRELYETAIELDPGCARAYMGLGLTHMFDWHSAWTDTPEESADLAIANARKALALDDTDSEAHRRLGGIYLFRGDHEQAEFHLDKALSLNPNDADSWAYRALYCIYDGRPLEALEPLGRATRRNPFHPSWYLWFIGLAHYGARQYEAAIGPLKTAIGLFPKFVAPRRHLAASYARLGRLEEARRECKAILELEPDFKIAKLAPALAYQNPDDLAHYLDGLRKAGLPD